MHFIITILISLSTEYFWE